MDYIVHIAMPQYMKDVHTPLIGFDTGMCIFSVRDNDGRSIQTTDGCILPMLGQCGTEENCLTIRYPRGLTQCILRFERNDTNQVEIQVGARQGSYNRHFVVPGATRNYHQFSVTPTPDSTGHINIFFPNCRDPCETQFSYVFREIPTS